MRYRDRLSGGNARTRKGGKGGNHLKIYDLQRPREARLHPGFRIARSQPDATRIHGLAPGASASMDRSRPGVEKNRVYAAYGTGSHGVHSDSGSAETADGIQEPREPDRRRRCSRRRSAYITCRRTRARTRRCRCSACRFPRFQGHTTLKKRDLMIVASEQGRGDHCGRARGPNDDRPAPHWRSSRHHRRSARRGRSRRST